MSIIDDKTSRTPLGSQKPSGENFGIGEIILEKISPQNTSKKFSSFIRKGSHEVNIGGMTFMKTANGNIYVSDKKITCGNVTYPFNRIIGIVRSGNNLIKSVEAILESIIDNKRYHLKLEIISENSDSLFATLNKIVMRADRDLTRHTIKNQSNFLKDRFGLQRN